MVVPFREKLTFFTLPVLGKGLKLKGNFVNKLTLNKFCKRQNFPQSKSAASFMRKKYFFVDSSTFLSNQKGLNNKP